MRIFRFKAQSPLQLQGRERENARQVQEAPELVTPKQLRERIQHAVDDLVVDLVNDWVPLEMVQDIDEEADFEFDGGQYVVYANVNVERIDGEKTAA